jgi:hypothetical protein
MPPFLAMPRGRTVSTGSVVSGQSIVRLENTPRLLVLFSTRLQAAAGDSDVPIAATTTPTPIAQYRALLMLVSALDDQVEIYHQ